MFNEERKIAFMNDVCNSVVIKKRIIGVFNSVEPYEEIYGDISSWDKIQIKQFFKDKTNNYHTICTYLETLKQYYHWSLQHGYAETGSWLSMRASDLLSTNTIQDRMIENPTSLLNYLDNAFSSAEKKGKSCLTFRTYQWFAFCGVPESVAFSITKNALDLKNRIITVCGYEKKIIPEAFKTISAICYIGDNDTPVLNIENQKYESRTISTFIASRHDPDVRKLLYRDVYKSGIFYRAFCQEMLGFPVRFDEDIECQIAAKGYSGVGNSLQKRKARLNATTKREYKMWKTAFALDV